MEEVRSATRRALVRLVDLCLEECASLLLIAGDLYDGDYKDFSTALFFSAQMTRLQQVGTQVVWLRGNHDAANRMTKHLRPLPHVFELSTAAPQTQIFEHLGVAVHGQGYVSREVRENLVANYPKSHSGLCNIGLLHTALDGRQGHAPYAPCSPDQLRAKGYDYWALGHVHQREIIGSEPWIVFPGNLQGRHIKETGPKGCMVLEIDDVTVLKVEERILDSVRWETCDVNLTDASHMDDILDAASRQMRSLRDGAGGRVLATRVRLLGSTRTHAAICSEEQRIIEELRASSLEAGELYLERVEFLTHGLSDPETFARREDALGELFRALSLVSDDEHELRAFWEEVVHALGSVPVELLRHEDIDPRAIVDEARRLLEGRLFASD